MIVTVLWEDQRGVQAKGFGPHELLLSAVANALSGPDESDPQLRKTLKKHVQGVAKKGNGKILKTVQRDLENFNGRLIAVLDRDRAHELWPHDKPPNCMQGISQRFRASASGTYDLVFLVNNTETLLDATCDALRHPRPTAKPDPDERDRILNKAAWATPDVRHEIRQLCQSFDRIVTTVAKHAPTR
jgi:hypothetical protein